MLNSFEPMINVNKPVKKAEVVSCSKCKSEWFEQVKINQFRAEHIVVPGQAVPTANGQEFFMLRCIKCSELYQPRVMITAQDQISKEYNSMLDNLEK